MPFRSPLLAASLVGLALAGCGQENQALIPSDKAEQLTALVTTAGEASASGDCDRAHRAVTEARAELAGLPRRTSRRLKRNLRQWLAHLDRAIGDECGKNAEPEETQTATPTPSVEETASPTETPEETPTATPSPTATAEPTETAEPETPPEEPAGTGGVPPGDG